MGLPPEFSIPSFGLRLFGVFEARVNGRAIPHLRSRKGEQLLALLAIRRGTEIERRRIADTLWPDSEPWCALDNLRRCLTDLRRALGAEADRITCPTRHTLRFDDRGAAIDFIDFDAAITDSQRTAEAISLYRGPLLDGCAEEWVFPERELREKAFLSALEMLAAQALESSEPLKAVSYLRKVVLTDPLRQSAQRALMQALADSGELAALVLAYRELRLYLHREMNSEPDAETTALFHRLRAKSRSPGKEACKNNAVLAGERAVPPASGYLPVPFSSLIGRESEIESVVACLRTDRLVTLTGSGGVGKTRLAIAVAEEAAPDFVHGVWFVDVAPLSAPDLVPQSVASALKISEAPGRSFQNTLLEYLCDRRLLLLLDNCEHLLPACAALADTLLSGCSHLRILATSRRALGLNGEVVRRVPSLTVPETEEITTCAQDPAGVLANSAVELFVTRARAAAAHFRLHNDNQRAVVNICRHLAGIPLAIELAAARTRSLSVFQIAARLRDRFDLLAAGASEAAPRHQTLRATLVWSYDLLSDEERALLRRLSVFAGGWTLEAAEAVCSDDVKAVKRVSEPTTIPSRNVLDLLTALVDASLVVYEEQPDGTGRYRLLETTRQHAGERLTLEAERIAFHRQHRDYFLSLVEEIRPKLSGPEQTYWLQILETEYDNLRQAMNFCLEEPEGAEKGLRLGAALQLYWPMRGHLSEGKDRLLALLAHPLAQEQTTAYADAINGAAILNAWLGDFASYRSLIEQSLALWRELDNKRGIANCLMNFGILANYQGDSASARSLLEESLAIYRALGDRLGVAKSLRDLGDVVTNLGEYSSARLLYEESLAILRELGDKQIIATTQMNLGILDCRQGDYASARSLTEESLVTRRELGDKSGIAYNLMILGNVDHARGDFAAARSQYELSVAIQRELGDKLAIARALNYLGSVARHQEDYSCARKHIVESLSLFRGMGNKQGIASSLAILGLLDQSEGNPTSARSRYQESLAIQRDVGDKQGIAECLKAFAGLYAEECETEQAARLWAAAERLREDIGAPLPPCERETYECDLAAARQTLGKADFLAAWAQGNAFTTEQAVDFANHEVDWE